MEECGDQNASDSGGSIDSAIVFPISNGSLVTEIATNPFFFSYGVASFFEEKIGKVLEIEYSEAIPYCFGYDAIYCLALEMETVFLMKFAIVDMDY